MWLSASLCVLLCAFSLPPFSASISLWILSMYFWNNEHRAPLFVFPHQNRARVTEGSSDLVISAFHWLMQPVWIPAGACAWAVHGMDPPARPRQRGSVAFVAGRSVKFSLFFSRLFKFLFFPSELCVPGCGHTWNGVCCTGVPGFTLPSAGQPFPSAVPPHPIAFMTPHLLIFTLHLFPPPQTP